MTPVSDSPQTPAVAVSLRLATVDDLTPVVDLENQVHVAPWTRSHFEAEMAKPYSRFLVLTDDETDQQIFGFIVFWMMFDECQILNVVVNPTYQKQGYGLLMVRQAVKDSLQKNLKRVVLDVRKSNLPAIQLYQKVGFLTSSVQKSFYSNGEDAYSMELRLQGEDVAKLVDF
jgi:ribosomal-protein-alanine N-acetyltransferase